MISPRALERRIKRHLRSQPQRFFASCAPGFEPQLATELHQLPGITETTATTGGIDFVGSLDTIYHANLQLRTAHRLLLRIDEFLAQSRPMLFNHARKIAWERYLGCADGYHLRCSSKQSRLQHKTAIETTIAAAITAALEPLELAPTLQAAAQLTFHARLFRDRCTVSSDTSGEHLYRRGYKTEVGTAPLRETLAAGVLLGLELTAFDLIVDPFCGSGTLLTEAAMILSHTPPGLQRGFAFEAAPYFQGQKWARLRATAAASIRPLATTLVGFDLAPDAVSITTRNALAAGFPEIRVTEADALKLPFAELAKGHRRPLLISNLPYGERIGAPKRARALVRHFIQHLARHGHGWEYALITKDPDLLEQVGITPQRTLHFSNGGLDVTLVHGLVQGAVPKVDE